MKHILITILLMTTLTSHASPIMQGGQAIRTETCNPSTTCYVRKMWAQGTRQAHNFASGLLLAAAYAQVPQGCWLADSNERVIYKMRYYLKHSDSLQLVAMRALKRTPFACQ